MSDLLKYAIELVAVLLLALGIKGLSKVRSARGSNQLAAVAMAGAMIVLWLIGNPYVWTGAPAGLAAIGIRAWYLASEELVANWEMSETTLTGPGPRTKKTQQSGHAAC